MHSRMVHYGYDRSDARLESAKASASNLLMCALCGADTGSGMGLLAGCTVLYPEALVLDTDIYHQIRINAAGSISFDLKSGSAIA